MEINGHESLDSMILVNIHAHRVILRKEAIYHKKYSIEGTQAPVIYLGFRWK